MEQNYGKLWQETDVKMSVQCHTILKIPACHKLVENATKFWNKKCVEKLAVTNLLENFQNGVDRCMSSR